MAATPNSVAFSTIHSKRSKRKIAASKVTSRRAAPASTGRRFSNSTAAAVAFATVARNFPPAIAKSYSLPGRARSTTAKWRASAPRTTARSAAANSAKNKRRDKRSREEIAHFLEQAALARTIVVGQRLGQLLDQQPLLARQLAGHFKIHDHVQIPAAAPIQTRHALAAQRRQFRPAGGSRRHLDFLLSPRRGHRQVASQYGLRKGYGNVAIQFRLAPLKKRMRLNAHRHVEVAVRSSLQAGFAFPAEPQLMALVDSRRNRHLLLRFLLDAAAAMAGGAGVADDGARAAAARAGAGDAEKSLLVPHLAAAAAGGARRRRRALARAPALAFAASGQAREAQRLFRAEKSLLEGQFQFIAQVAAAPRLPRPAPRATAEKIAEAEEVAEDIRKIGEQRRVEVAAVAGARAHPGMAETVVLRPLLRVAQHAVGFRGFLEFFFRSGILAIAVGMILQGQAAVGALDLLLVGVAADSQDLVIIALARHGCHSNRPLSPSRLLLGRRLPLGRAAVRIFRHPHHRRAHQLVAQLIAAL